MRRLVTAVLLAASVPAHAASDDFSIRCVTVCQQAFEGVVEDLSAALNYKALGPAEATGISGIGIAVLGVYTPVQNQDDWKTLTGSDVSGVGMAGLTVRKGLPFNFDVGAFYSSIPGAGASLYGAELRYAILPGGVAQPALALRATYTRSEGVDDFDYAAYGADVSISKGFTLLTPYLGAGYLKTSADPRGPNAAAAGLSRVKDSRTRVFAGLRIGLGFFDIVPEYEHVGSNNVYNLALGLSF